MLRDAAPLLKQFLVDILLILNVWSAWAEESLQRLGGKVASGLAVFTAEAKDGAEPLVIGGQPNRCRIFDGSLVLLNFWLEHCWGVHA